MDVHAKSGDVDMRKYSSVEKLKFFLGCLHSQEGCTGSCISVQNQEQGTVSPAL